MPSELLSDHESMMLELEAAELELEILAEAQAGLRIADLDEAVPGDAVPGDADPLEGAPAAGETQHADDSSASGTLEDLRDRGDVAALLSRAKALRVGDGVERDIEACLEHYRAAADLGDPHGKFCEALFYLSGAVVAEDLNTGLGKLRAAAQAGSLRAKVYLANVYELGVGRESDPDKADVWYRSAVRAAQIDVDPEEDEPGFVLAMAELGSIRHARTVLRDESIPKKERYGYLAEAKALGFALHQRNKQRASMEQEEIAREIEEAMAAPSEDETAGASGKHALATEHAPDDAVDDAVKKAEEEAKPQIGPSTPPIGERLTAFVIALVMVAGGVGVGVMGTAAAKQLMLEGAPVPIFGMHYGYILPAAVAASMLLVALVYEWRTILLSMVASGVLGAAGWTLWKNPAGSLFAERLTQAHVFGVVGLVVALFAIGLLGGTRRRRWSK